MKMIPVVTLLVACASLSVAQELNKKLVAPGPTGIFVNLGFELPTAAKPSGGIAAYRIERRAPGEKGWQQVADVQAPASLEELKSRISHALQLVPPPLRIDSIPVEWIWQRMQKGADSVRVYGSLLPVRLALGIVYLDTSAPRATPLEFRVSHLDSEGKATTASVSERVFYPPAMAFAKLKSSTSASSEREVRIQWASPAKTPTRVFETYRRENLSGAYTNVPVHKGVSKQGDSLHLEIRDTRVQPDRIYEYYLAPMDAYGNVGLLSDTVRLATYNFALAATATYAKVENLDTAGGLRIRWQLQNPGVVSGITVLRSEDWDSGFSAIGHLSPSTDEFIDQDIVPMKDYYYYIEAVGPLGERARSCATFHGLYQSSLTPFPPAGLHAEVAASGVRLTWTNTEEHIAGFYVYRGDAAATSFHQVSPFIPVQGSEESFVDSSSGMSPRFTYAYAVRSENTSHRLSPLSDTVYARPGTRSSPKAPLGLRATTDGRTVELVWQDMYSADPSLLGFKVLRRTKDGHGSTEFKELTDSLLPANCNHWSDVTSVKGRTYEYAVQTFDAFGGKSGLSAIVPVAVASEKPLPPAGLRASTQKDGILVEWDEVSGSGVMGYRVYRHERGKQPSRLASLKATANEFTDTNAKKGQLSFYFVTSVGPGNLESPPSVEVSARWVR